MTIKTEAGWIITKEDSPGGRPFDLKVVEAFLGTLPEARKKLLHASTESLSKMRLWMFNAETDVETIVRVRGIEGSK